MRNNVRRTQNKVSTLKMSRSILVQTKIKLVTLSLKLSLQKGCYKLHNKLALPLLHGERERSGKSSPLHPLLLLHGTTLPESGHVFLSSGVNENI